MNTTVPEPKEHIYKLKTEDLTWFQIWRKRAMPLIPGLALLFFTFNVVVNVLRGGDLDADRLVGSAIYTVIVMLIFSGISILSYQRNIGRLKAYELHLADDQIRQQMPGVSDLAVRKDEVTRITESQYGLFINTPKRNKRLVVWPTIEGYEEVKKHLATWQTIQEVAQFSMHRLSRQTANLIIILAMIALFVTDKVLIVLPAALVLLGVFTYILIELPRESKVLRPERFLMGLLLLVWSVIIIWRMLIVLG